MHTLLQRIQSTISTPQTSSLSKSELEQTNQILHRHNIADIPQEYLNFLHFYNGLNYQDAWLCGIFSKHEQINDICRFNIQLGHPLSRDIIFLGFNEFDLLGYNQRWQVYQIIDKDDFEVLEEYQDIEQALNYILKM